LSCADPGRRQLLAGLGLAGLTALVQAWPGGDALARPAPVTVFAASSLETALVAIARRYGDRVGGPLRLVFGASSAMARQIAQGAPADVFISADRDWMNWLGQRRPVVAGTRRNLLANRLVLIAPAASRVQLDLKPGMSLATVLGSGRLAMADPVSVPAGKYGRQALVALRAWDGVAGRLASAESVRAALAYVARGETPLGVVYATDALAEPRVRIVATFPAASHSPILYPAALVRDRAAARSVLAYLAGGEARSVFRSQGFLPA
jgi:molybdate transport system substrate-binding protein